MRVGDDAPVPDVADHLPGRRRLPVRTCENGGARPGVEGERLVVEHLGVDAAIRVFRLNTRLFPDSANAWDSLAEAHAARGDQDEAKALYAKARAISQQSKQGAATGE